ncbi:MAG TPA: hypothetical protein VGB15_19025 [Longimicrobium sp.]|jgi:hypothetical protein
MPRLARVRYVSIGHPDARMDDLVLDFRGREGRASDAVVWLRNGGGKSSLLNLFFSVVRPRLTDFLGGKAEGRRRLIDYVQRDDRAVVAAEWELDGSGGLFDAAEGPPRYLTGVFYERNPGSGAGSGDLNRFYFAAFVSPAEPMLTLEGLPLFTAGRDGSRAHRTLAGFRQEWRALESVHRAAGVQDTVHQNEWEKILEQAGIDPALFGYQLTMNQREGGADELFKFRESDEFVDFFLEMALDPSEGEDVARNIETFRERLNELSLRLRPERVLLEGLVQRSEPLAALAAERRHARGEAGERRAALLALREHLLGRARDLGAEVLAGKAAEHEAEEEAREMARLAAKAQRRSLGLRRYTLQARVQAARAEADRLKEEHRRADHARQLWSAAVPLREARRHQAAADRAMAELSRTLQEHAPLLRELGDAARRLHAAVRHRAERLRDEADAHDRRADAEWDTAREHQGLASSAAAEAATLDARAVHLQSELATEQGEWTGIVDDGAALPGETPSAALHRLSNAVDDLRQRTALAEHERTRTRAEREELGKRIGELQGAIRQTDAEQRQRQEALRDAEAQRRPLEENPRLREHIGQEEIDLDRMDAAVADGILRRAAAVVNERAVRLGVLLAEGERALTYLETHRLLPPRAGVEQVLAHLHAARVSAWSGWEYLSRTVPRREAREWVRQRPMLADGVIVPDAALEDAREALRGAELPLDAPVVVASQGTAEGEMEPVGIVVGPAGEALYDPEAAATERARREHRRDRDQAERERATAEHSELGELAGAIRAFRARFREGWFAERMDAIRRADDEIGRLREEAAELDRERQRADRAAEELEQALKALNDEHMERLRQHTRVDGHLRRWGTDRPTREATLRALHRDAEEARIRASAHLQSASEAGERAQEHAMAARGAGERAAETAIRLRSIRYLGEGEELPPAAGDVEALDAEYEQRRERYEGLVGESALRERYEAALRQQRHERQRFEDLARENGLDEGEVQRALDSLADPGEADARARAADGEMTAALAGKVRAEGVVRGVETDLEGLEKECRGVDAVPVFTDDTIPPEGAEAAAETALAEAEGNREAETHARTRAQDAAARWRDAEHRERTAGQHLQILETLETANADLLEQALAPGEAPPWATPAEEEVGARVEDLKHGLHRLRNENGRITTRRTRAVADIMEWMSRAEFEHLRSGVVQRLRGYSADDFEETAETVRNQLAIRLEIVTDEVERLEANRNALVVQLLSAAERGLHVLGAAARRSRLPDTVRGLGGLHFLKIEHGAPEDAAQRQARIAALLEDLAKGSAPVPRGLALVQQAVRRVGKPIQVRVLLPKPTKEAQYKPITELGRQSGGERLTSAILLYCTLAQLRASQRGQRLRPSGTLLLDNPIGAASWEPLLELQREVARAMGIQLIYATGIDSLGAVRMMPVVLRLKNDRKDRWSGESVVELAGGPSQLDVAHLRLQDDPATAPPPGAEPAHAASDAAS